MKFLSLDRLAGPGNSLAENFEILCLELVKADKPNHRTFRLSAPDSGIDIYSRDTRGEIHFAFQCKAYSRYRSNLLSSISNSVNAANCSFEEYPWSYYILTIPFVPSISQRTKIEKVLRSCQQKFLICDGDELESHLFRYPFVARRFFPDLLLVTPTEQGSITLGFTDLSPTLEIKLHVHTWGQVIPVRASPDAKCGSLLQLLKGQLSLPLKGYISCVAQVEYDVVWRLALEEKRQRELDENKSLSEEGLTNGSVIALKYNIVMTHRGQAFGGFRESYVYLTSFFDSTKHNLPKDIAEYDSIMNYWLDYELRQREYRLADARH